MRPTEHIADVMYPGQPATSMVAEMLFRTINQTVDDIVVVEGSGWDRPVRMLSSALADRLRWVGRGEDFAGLLLGLASSGHRVASFADDDDVRRFARSFGKRPFPTALVLHSIGGSDWGNDDFGFKLAASTPQQSIDFALISHRIAEDALVPGWCIHTSILDATSIATLLEPEDELVRDWLPDPETPTKSVTAAQEMLFGAERRRIPAVIDLNRPVGIHAGGDDRVRAVIQAGRRPFFLDQLNPILERVFNEFGALTGRFYEAVKRVGAANADYAIVTDGPTEALEESLRWMAAATKQKLAVVTASMLQPFPAREVASALLDCKVVTVVESSTGGTENRADIVRSAMAQINEDNRPIPAVFAAHTGGVLQPKLADAAELWANMLPGGRGLARFQLGIDLTGDRTRVPSLESLYQAMRRHYPKLWDRSLVGTKTDLHPRRSATTILMVGSDVNPIRELALTLAQTAMDVVKKPVASDSSCADLPVGREAQVTISIGAISPAAASMNPVDVIVAVRTESLASILEDRLADSPALFLPARLTSTLNPAVARMLAEKRVRVFAVEIDDGIDEIETLTRLVMAWSASESTFPEQLQLTSGVTNLESKPWTITEEVSTPMADPEPSAPDAVRRFAERSEDLGDASRFWRTIGFSYVTGRDGELSSDPYVSSNTIPARTGSFRATVNQSEQIPAIIPERCTGCGACAAFCPEGAIRISSRFLEEIVLQGIARVADGGIETIQLERIAKPLAKKAHRLAVRDQLQQNRTVGDLLEQALEPVLEAMNPAKETKELLLAGFAGLTSVVGGIPLLKTERFFDQSENEQKDSGQLFLLGVDPAACTACGLCVEVCPDDALEMREATDERVKLASSLVRTIADGQPDLYTSGDPSPMDYLMGRKPAESVVGSDPSSPGSGTRMTVRLVCSLIESKVGARFAALAEEASELVDATDDQIKRVLTKTVEVNDFDAFSAKLDDLKSSKTGSLSASDLAELAGGSGGERVDTVRLGLLTKTRMELEAIKSELQAGDSGDGRARMAAVFGSGRMLSASHAFPFNPYAFPWIHVADGSALAAAEGLFEGIMETMCSTFSTLRRARKLAKGLKLDDSDPAHPERLAWKDLTDDEWLACPPVCVFLDDASIPRSWAKEPAPINLFILDRGETIDEVGWDHRLWPLARPEWFLLQSTAGTFEHFADGVRDGVSNQGPSVFRLFAPEPAASGFASDQTVAVMEAAVTSQKFPLIRYDPDPDRDWTDRWSLVGNEAVMSKAKLEVTAEMESDMNELRSSMEEDAKGRLARLSAEHDAVYHEKLVRRLLALSGFAPGSEESERKLRELSS